jgi:large subunit ribosomal protein L13
MTTTARTKASEIYKDWHVLDAADRPLGRVATEAAVLLRGKHKPTYEPHLDDGDFVIIVNAAKVRVSGRKTSQMTYYRHSGFPGGLKSRSYPEMMTRFPERVLERAVKGMLPSGTLGEAMAKHLKVYRGPDHPHQSQVIGSERARVAREARDAEMRAHPAPPRPLRPLTGRVQLPPEPVEEEQPAVDLAPEPEPQRRRGLRRRSGERDTATSGANAAAPEAEVTSGIEATVEEVENIERVAAEAAAETAEAPAEEAPAPRRRRRRAQPEE